jgi:hypothetical protein
MTLLYLDVDGRLPAGLVDRITWACELWRWPLVAIRYEKTRHGWHVVIGVRKRLAAPLIVAAQAVLGSDRNREMFNLMRVQSLAYVPLYWRKRWNVLYSRHWRTPQHGRNK